MLIDWFTIVAQVINFLILVWLLRRFLYGPIIRTMDEREARIAAQLSEAERMEREAQQEAEDYRQKNREMEDLRQEMLRQAGKEAETWRQELFQEARQEIDEMRRKWRHAVHLEQEDMMQDVRQRTVRQVYAIARRALTDLADADLERHLAQVFVRRLQAGAENGRHEVTTALRQVQRDVVIRSAFDLAPETRQMILEAVQSHLAANIPVRFETTTDLICGVELKADDFKIAWSLEDYLGSLEEDLIEALGERADEDARETNGSDNGAG